MKFNVSTDYLDPIEIDTYEHVSITLPSGLQVTVFSDVVYLATPDDVLKHKDGRKIWDGKS